MSYQAIDIITAPATDDQDILQTEETFGRMLTDHGLEFTERGYLLTVGEISAIQGWILHISVIRSQIVKLLETVLPVLASQKVPFKIVSDIHAARSILDGEFGYSQIGKVISIYPNSIQETRSLAAILIEITGSFKGPA